MSRGELTYLALGDSYTIGTGASHESRNYPSLLGQRLEVAAGCKVRVVNPAVNGFTTIDLLAREIGFIGELKPDLVSVLIGVNDLVRGRSLEAYRHSLIEIYDAIATLGLAPGRALAISIPDWSVVPAAPTYGDPLQIRRLTEAFNAAAREEAVRRSFSWFDLSAVSRSWLGSAGWISTDDLHPGDRQYAAWVDAIWAEIGPAWTITSRPD
jgi:lysophospholipase L1-like esterase